MGGRRILVLIIIVFSVMLTSFGFYAYQILFVPNILVDQPDRYFAIYDGTTFSELQKELDEQRIVSNLMAFSFIAKIKGYDKEIKPGMYLFTEGMNNLNAVNMLRAGRQVPVKLTFNSARRLEDLPPKLTSTIQLDSTDLAPMLLSSQVSNSYGFDSLNFISMFIPNTYEVYWTISASDLLDRMKLEYDRFWNEKRLRLADSIGLTPQEVSTLASIVESETNMNDEKPRLAGVYINRLKRGIPLQADPTLVFALGIDVRRVINADKEIDSPYNTYKYRGLPPGPIKMPSIPGIDAVLNYENHQYLYFCAKADFSGYHEFAESLTEHNVNAARFQQALNLRGIYR
ncbi:MAG: endolytic transglycosylase MltG [Bacteroidota bacterium]